MRDFSIDLQITAHEDIREIRDYLAIEAPASVDRIINTIYDRIADLGRFPESCAKFAPRPEFRRLVVGKYSVFYKVFPEQNLVRVFHVFHQARDTWNMV